MDVATVDTTCALRGWPQSDAGRATTSTPPMPSTTTTTTTTTTTSSRVRTVPLRQWVVTLPFELRMVVATRADALTRVLRIAIDEISRAYTDRAKALGVTDPRIGAITFVHRFGGSLNLHPHFHIMAIDGVYADAATRFEPAEPPTPALLRSVLERIHRRVVRWARRQAKSQRSHAETLLSGLESTGTQRGLFASLDDHGRVRPDDESARFDPRQSHLAVRHQGFNIHAGVAVAAWDRDGRERLCRYGARPPFSLARLSVLPDGRIAYRTKYPGPHGHTHRVMTPVEFLARLAALIPPPRYPLVRYHGVLAPNSKLRKRVVPPRAEASREPPPRRTVVVVVAPEPACVATDSPRDPIDLAVIVARPVADRRQMHRIDWAELLRRVYRVDALACPRCECRLEFIAVVTERSAIRRVLEHLGEPVTGPPATRVLDAWAG